jgi:hypothetical protein
MHLSNIFHLNATKKCKFLMWIMATNSFGKRNFMQPMRRLSMHSWTVQFLSFWSAGEGFLFFSLCSQCVPIMFPWGSHEVPEVFPLAPWFYPIWFAQRLNSHVYKLKRGCQRDANLGSYVGSSQSSKNIGDGPIKWLLLPWHTPSLTNRIMAW